MTSTTQFSPSLGTQASLEPLRAKWGWVVALGIVYLLAGIVALGSVVMATAVTVFVVGMMMMVAGIAEVVSAFQVQTWGRFAFWFGLGALYIIAGFATFENPLLAAVVLTLLLGIALIASGVVRVLLSFSMQDGMPWIGMCASGVITLLIGLIVLAHWPVSSIYVLGLFLGIDLVLAGASWIAVGLGLKSP